MLFVLFSQTLLALGLLVGVHSRDRRDFGIVPDETHTVDVVRSQVPNYITGAHVQPGISRPI